MSEIGQKFIQTVREIAAERPDYVYERPSIGDDFIIEHHACAYVANGEPSCLIGQAAWRLGYIDASLEYDADGCLSEVNFDSVSGLLHYLGLADEVHLAEVNWLITVQGAQDRGTAWGKAVTLADATFKLPLAV